MFLCALAGKVGVVTQHSHSRPPTAYIAAALDPTPAFAPNVCRPQYKDVHA